MAFDKVAVDQLAKDYWTKFYGEYGKLWVREIPRKIKKAAAAELSKSNKTAATDLEVSGTVLPFGHAFLDNGGVAIEGIFDHATIGKFAFQSRFDNEGELTSFDSIKLAAIDSKACSAVSSSRGSSSKKASKGADEAMNPPHPKDASRPVQGSKPSTSGSK